MDREELIRAVARETGVRLSRADPILDAAAIFEVVMRRSLASVAETTSGAADRITAAGAQNAETSRKAADALINQAGHRLIEALQEAARQAATKVDEATAARLAEFQGETLRMQQVVQRMARVVWVMTFLAACGGAAAMAVLLATLRPWP